MKKAKRCVCKRPVRSDRASDAGKWTVVINGKPYQYLLWQGVMKRQLDDDRWAVSPEDPPKTLH